MTLKVCKVLEDGGLAAPLESFSFNFKLNSGIHGLSNVGGWHSRRRGSD